MKRLVSALLIVAAISNTQPAKAEYLTPNEEAAVVKLDRLLGAQNRYLRLGKTSKLDVIRQGCSSIKLVGVEDAFFGLQNITAEEGAQEKKEIVRLFAAAIVVAPDTYCPQYREEVQRFLQRLANIAAQ